VKVCSCPPRSFPGQDGRTGRRRRRLPPALARAGADVRLLLPGYAPLLQALENSRLVARLRQHFGAATVELRRGRLPGLDLPVYLIDSPFSYDRPATLPEPGPRDCRQPRRFGLLGWSGRTLGCGDVDRDWRADIVHAHDWHAGLACPLARTRAAAGQRVHGAQPCLCREFDGAQLAELQLPRSTFAPEASSSRKGSFIKAGSITPTS